MKTRFTAFRSPIWLVAVVLGCAGAGQSGAQIPAASLPGFKVVDPIIKPVNTGKIPVLAGQLVTPVVKKVANSNAIRIKTGVSLSNTGNKAAKDVTITAYLSDDTTLSDDDTKLITLDLADYNAGSSKLAKGQTLNVPLHYKLPGALAAALQGKYLIFVLSATNAEAGTTVVFGPITLP